MEPWLVVLLAVYTQNSFPNPTAFNSTRTNTDWNGVSGRIHSLHKRGFIQLAGAVKCATGRSPLLYLDYGCHCGLGGKGWPKDRTDWCCHRHDCCYDIAEKQGCHPHFEIYKWTCMNSTVICDTTVDRCKKIICMCDKEAASCWRSSPFNKRNIFWPNFLCGYIYPTCNFNSSCVLR